MSRTRKRDYPRKRDSRRFDPSCRNHGSCKWCMQGRLFARMKVEQHSKLDLRAYLSNR